MDPCNPVSETAKIGMIPLSGLYLVILLIAMISFNILRQELLRRILLSSYSLSKNMLIHTHIPSVLLYKGEISITISQLHDLAQLLRGVGEKVAGKEF
jgi:hypothetical protein